MTRPSIYYDVQPQRRSQGGWQACLVHQAERWATIRIHRFKTPGGRPGTATRVMSSWPTKAEAQAAADSLASAGRKIKGRILGDRFPASGRKIIARSLTPEQYKETKK